VKKNYLARFATCLYKMDSGLKFINYLRMARLTFPFAMIVETTYYRRETAMNPKFDFRWFSIFRAVRPLVLAGLLFNLFPLSLSCTVQAEDSRRVKTKVDPEYPELARRLNLKGIVRVQVFIAAGGSVITVKELGGNPVLLDALIRAVKKWKYEPADKDSVIEVKFDFSGS
jgi:TonB family protein